MGGSAQSRREPDVAVVIPTVGRSTLAETVVALLNDDTIAEVVVVADREISQPRARAERVPLGSADSDYWCREAQAVGLRCARAGLTGVFDRSLRAEHRFERSLPSFLALARVQALELEAMRRQYPELTDDAGA